MFFVASLETLVSPPPHVFASARKDLAMPPAADTAASRRWAQALDRIAREASREAFAEIFNHFAPRVKGFLLGRGFSDARAEDIAQDTMLAVWRKAALFDPNAASASTWIFAIARNLSIDARRRERRAATQGIDDIEADYDIDPAPLGDEALIAGERDGRVRAALETLSEPHRQAVRLSFFEERPHSEIARLLGIPLGTVKSRLRLAMDRLRLALEELRT